MYNVVCNFSIGINHYACNSRTTCLNSDGTYDCCAKNIVGCIVDAASLLVPTVQPTAAIRENACSSQGCHVKYKAAQCYLYESINSDTLCSEDGTEYCCGQDRSDCCQTSNTAAVVTFGGVACLILLFLCYRYFARHYSKIIPVTVEPPDNFNSV